MRLKVGQVGVGSWGQFHCELLSRMPEVDFVGVFHIKSKILGKTAGDYGTREFIALNELLDHVDALVITASTRQHFTIAYQALSKDVHVFVEKPICLSIADADKLVGEAEARGLVLQVGHIERFNPAFRALHEVLESPTYIEAFRSGSYSPQNSKVSVVFDLMVHDLDLILGLVSSTVLSVQGNVQAIVSHEPDFANARVVFKNGCVANVTASRLSKKKVRRLSLLDCGAFYELDLVERSAFRTIGNGKACVQESLIPDTDGVLSVNPLRLELQAFIGSVANKTAPVVDGHAGREALRLATMIQNNKRNVDFS